MYHMNVPLSTIAVDIDEPGMVFPDGEVFKTYLKIQLKELFTVVI